MNALSRRTASLVTAMVGLLALAGTSAAQTANLPEPMRAPIPFEYVVHQADAGLVQRLIGDLQNPDESVRLRAAKQLGKLGAAAGDAIPALQNALKDADEDVRRVASISLKAIQAAEISRPQGEIRVNFDALNASAGSVAGEKLNTYLAQFGISVTDLTPGTRVEVMDCRTLYEGKAARATSSPNVIGQTGSTKAVSFTMRFREPVEKAEFTRVGLIAAGPSGITHPYWNAVALDASGNELDRIREILLASYIDIPAKTFTLRGPGIAAIRWESNARDFAAFGGVLVDDLVLTTRQVENPIQRLIRDLQNPDESVRMRAAKELGKIGPAAQEAVPMLQKLLNDPDEDVRRIARASLARVVESIMPPTNRPDLFMLSVGIDRYLPPVGSLKGCVNDAEGMATVFRQQAGKLYNRVDAQVLTDASATRAQISAGLDALRNKGKTGDWYVIVLSGHGGPKLNRWGFIAHDGGDITDATLLQLADELAGAGKKVVVIIDACFAGQLRFAAHPILNRYTDPRKGGIILMISSMPSQTSAALQNYSAFARAVEEGLVGMADYDRDQTITLKELRRFTYNRVYELCLDRRSLPGLPVGSQDSAIDASISIPETTVLTQAQKAPPPTPTSDGPFTPMPQLTGVWTLGNYRLRLDSTGTFRATLSPQNGDGVYKVAGNVVLLHHRQGTDRLENVAVTSEEFRFRFQGRNVVLRRESVTRPPNTVAGTSWSGSETLAGYGKLTFQFGDDEKAVMIDAKSTVHGSWTQTGNEVTITFANCVYQATIKGQTMSGNARFTTDDRTWTFSLTRDTGTPPGPTPPGPTPPGPTPPGPTPPGPAANVAGTTWTGTESLQGFGALTFEFHPDGKAVMIDAQSTVNGNWTQTGNQVTITFQNCVYQGTINGQVLAGNARYTTGEANWTFSVTRNPSAAVRSSTTDGGRLGARP